jgi:acetoin utilization protein AcuB
MIVEEIMATNVSTLLQQNTISDAIRVMSEKKIRHIPIIDENKHLVGIISDRDIKDASPSILHCCERQEVYEQPIGSIMKTDLITGHPLDFVEEIAAIFYDNKIDCLPIVKDNVLVGIITETDLLHTLVELTGAHQPGSQIEVRVPNKEGMLLEIFSCFRNHRVNIQSVLVYPDKMDENKKVLVFRVQTINPMNIIEDLKKAGHDVLWPNLPGMQKS